MPTAFVTGYPGFLGSQLLPRILGRSADARAVCLVQPKFAPMARERVAELEVVEPTFEGRVEVVEGDITRSGLGLPALAPWRRDVDEIYHLAAVYDLTIPRDLGMRVNVDGTHHMLEFAADCPRLRRFQYVSTCYVSGRYPGVFTESDLIKGQEFNNHYEETKYLAEVEVQQRMEAGLPATVYRPSIVVGDSRTGATQKYDGPYAVLRWILRQPLVAFLPVAGDPERYRANVVPSDFVIDALDYLSRQEDSEGQVYHLADPTPPTVDEMIDILAHAARRTVVRVPLPRAAAKAAIEYVPFVERILQISPQAVDYFVHPTHYGTEATQRALQGSGIHCPSFQSYAKRLARFVKENPDVARHGMV
jgi:thioester reductase-like protein